MTRKRKAILAAGVLIGLIVICRTIYNLPYSEDDVYSNGLVYSNKSGELFSGTVKIGDWQHSGQYSYCKGEPCGHFESSDLGSVTQEGTYLDKSLLPSEVQKIIGQRLFAVSVWDEGVYHPASPSDLSICILEPHWGTFDFKNYQHIDQIASIVAKATSTLKYKYLEVMYVNSFGYHPGYRYSVSYKMRNGIPTLYRRDSM